ncbi:MAG: UDP-N-acetylmuramoyl-L-alanyl-D-glutamate--2,6-diaminopimelate ligase [Parvibaculales bacterium]|jgi:UDP-N-acetylmuramoyl-L-alanyl-D-glutamate--2,6-diaminopimelate ligase|nr:UDP-N-acetylmuramoyl-L-alanyl-D-glutamate--2,6-diaminopimelate ligase [Alphaproteobacteria bacterium]
MRLDELTHMKLADATMASIDICGISADSRTVQPGYLFAALAGVEADGRSFVGQAIENGAAAILTQEPMVAGVPVVTSDNPRRDLALMAARFFEVQPPHIAAITGTNGKTSSAVFLRQLFAAANYKAASLGTLGIDMGGGAIEATLDHTTPEPVRLHAALRDLVAHQVTHLAMEASSHGLAQYRLDGVHLSLAGFTNLSRDHLDYHAGAEEYAAAKQRLFTEILAADGTAVITMTQDAGVAMAAACAATGRSVLEVGRPGDAVHMAITARRATGLDVTVDLDGARHDVTLPLIGDFQIENLTLAMGMAKAAGIDATTILEACRDLQAPRGRMQLAGRTSEGAAVFVDYAHTPDALENALTALRRHVPQGGRLLVMFGCGGDRDSGKRPEMGAVAANHADMVFVTDDNPRHEDAADIRAAIMAACPDATEIGDRGAAIEAVLAAAQADDLVLLAGKGHESGQIIGDIILPFDDVTMAQSILASKGGHHA